MHSKEVPLRCIVFNHYYEVGGAIFPMGSIILLVVDVFEIMRADEISSQWL